MLIMKKSHFKNQWHLACVATGAGLTIMLPLFLSFSVRELRYQTPLSDGWSSVLLITELILLVLTPFWALSMARGFLANPRVKHYRDELLEDGERVLREKGAVASDQTA